MGGIPIIGDEIQVIGDDEKRAQNCLDQVQKVLERYDCVIIPVITIAGTKIISQMDIQPRKRTVPPNPN